MICRKRDFVNQMDASGLIGYKPGLPMVKKRLMAKGIITRMDSRIKNKENFQFESRVLVQNSECQKRNIEPNTKV